jgi:hypothetical protein
MFATLSVTFINLPKDLWLRTTTQNNVIRAAIAGPSRLSGALAKTRGIDLSERSIHHRSSLCAASANPKATRLAPPHVQRRVYIVAQSVIPPTSED